LNIDQVVGILASEKELGSDQWADEGGDTVPRLAELETSGCRGWVADDNSVRVGGSFESSKATGDNKSAGAETTKGCDTMAV
jgi:hypothetical protein